MHNITVLNLGVEDVGSSTITSKLGGGFRDKSDPGLRAEFLSIARMQ